MALGDQLLDVLAINRQPLGLLIRSVRTADVGSFVPVQAQETQRFKNQLQAILDFARLVSVLDTQNELAAAVPRQR